MQVVGKNDSNEQKLLEEKRDEMNKLIGLNNISIKENITLLINGWCAEHIKTLHKEYPNTERLAICKVEPQGKGIFLMTDMVFPGQKGVGGEVETTKEGMEWLNKELLSRGEKGTEWNCVLHSHHHMGVFWSGTDDNARLSLNDGRQLAWAVVTAYEGDTISYKGCVNFYKPYNIEIDVEVKEADAITIVDKYKEYLTKVEESEASYYDFLLEENKEYIEKITDKPSYSRVLDYLGVDITKELDENYEKIKNRVGNPELLDYLNKLGEEANVLAKNEVENSGTYKDMLVEYGAFCEWSDNLLTQLEKNREKSISKPYSPPLLSSTTYQTNRYLEDDDYDIYEFTTNKYDESFIRHMFKIDIEIPMKMGKQGEWLVWSYLYNEYVYVEERADNYYY